LSADRKREAAENSDLPREGRLHLLPPIVKGEPRVGERGVSPWELWEMLSGTAPRRE
jgi:hypothetical protein